MDLRRNGSLVVVWLSLTALCATTTLASNNDNDNDNAEEFDVWEDGHVADMYYALGCPDFEQEESKIYTQETWALYQSTYLGIVDEETRSIDPEDLSGDYGFLVPVHFGMGPFGRSVYAEEDIPVGTVVWTALNTARFTEASQYREFMQALPPLLACDALDWAYTRLDLEKNDMVCLDLDPGSFINQCTYEKDCNMVLHPRCGRNSGCDVEFMASRDIPAGEELLIEYSFAEGHSGWVALGLKAADDSVPDYRDAKLQGVHDEEDEDEDDDEDDEDDTPSPPPTIHLSYLEHMNGLASTMRQEFQKRNPEHRHFVDYTAPISEARGEKPVPTPDAQPKRPSSVVRHPNNSDEDDEPDDDAEPYFPRLDESEFANHQEYMEYIHHMRFMERRIRKSGVGLPRFYSLGQPEDEEEVDKYAIDPEDLPDYHDYKPWPKQGEEKSDSYQPWPKQGEETAAANDYEPWPEL